MATKNAIEKSGITTVDEIKEKKEEPTVTVFLPLLDDAGSELGSVDQTVNVTINGKVTQIRRGEYVNVKIPVFLQLKNQYPNL